MNATEREAIARMVSRASKGEVDEDAAKETVENYMPQFIAQYTDKPRSFKMDSNAMMDFMSQIRQKYNIPIRDDDYVRLNMASNTGFEHEFKTQSKMISAEKQNRKMTLGKPLEELLGSYVDMNKIQQLRTQYHGHNWHMDPSKALYRNPNSKRLQSEAAQYATYLNGVKRAQQLLNYLNNNKINSRIDINPQDPSQLVAFLPEHNNMMVKLMADNPREIGNVSTWHNNFGYNYPEVNTADLKDIPAAGIVDALLNPKTQIQNVNVFARKGNSKPHTTFVSPHAKVPIFVTGLDENSKDPLTEKAVEQNETADRDMVDDNGDDEAENDNKITPHDKAMEIQKRAKDQNFIPIDTQAKADEERKHHGLFATIYNQGRLLGMENIKVAKNKEGVYKYTYQTTDNHGYKHKGYGIIGGYIPPEADGSYKLTVNGKFKGYSVPGMRGYIDTKTGQLKVKRFNSILREEVRKTMSDELLNPDIVNTRDSYGALDNLYTTDSYSTIIQKGVNDPKYEDALVKTLRGRIRLQNEVLEAGNALNESPKHVKDTMTKLGITKQDLKDFRNGKPSSNGNKRQIMMATQDLRTIPTAWQNVVDREMTGIGKTMGASLFMGDNVDIQPDGSLKPKNPDQKAKSPLHELPMFNYNKYDPADRNIMAFNQAIRNVPFQKVNVAMMTMSGYTENDAAVVTKKYATNPKNMVPDEKTGKLRPLRRGDKITDFHGNKSTISEIIDPNEKDPELRKKLSREIAIVKANPDLDVIVNPYSSISRLNTGSIHEMQDGGVTQLKTPKEYPNIDLTGISMGKENYAVCVGQKVDEKTAVYNRDDFLNHGKGRRFSHQLAAGAASADLPKTLSYVYGNNIDSGWPKFFDDIHVLGFDIDKNHKIGYYDFDKPTATIKLPSKEQIAKIAKMPRKEREAYMKKEKPFQKAFLRARHEAEKKHIPITMELPTYYHNAAGNLTNKLVVPFEQIKDEVRVLKEMGVSTKGHSATMNQIRKIYEFGAGFRQPTKPAIDPKTGKLIVNKNGSTIMKDTYDPKVAGTMAKNLENKIKAKDFGKKSNVIKREIYSAPMPDSSTGVLTPDPNLDIDTVAAGPDVYDNLHLNNPDEKIVIWRDPILRDGGFRFVHVVKDKRLTGFAVNPVIVKSMDADFDGDTIAGVPIHNKEARQELEKQTPSKNLIDLATKKPESYLETGLELQGSLYRQGDTTAQKDLADPNVTPDTVRAIVKKGFQNDAAYGIGIDMRSKDSYFKSLESFIISGAKGHCERDKNGVPIKGADGHIVSKAFKQAEHYYDGQRTDQDMHESMIGLAVKADGVGPAGGIQQKLLWPGRNYDPKDVMDFTYRATQSTLQAKHDGKEAKKRINAVLEPIPNIMNGYQPYATQKDKQNGPTLTPKTFAAYADDLYNDQLGLNVSDNTIDGVAKMLESTTKGKEGKIMGTKDRVQLADPLDILAYKGDDDVVNVLQNAMDNDKPIAAGRYTKHFEMPERLCSQHVLGRYYGQDKANEKNAQEKQQMPQQTRQNEMQNSGRQAPDDTPEINLSDLQDRKPNNNSKQGPDNPDAPIDF